MTDKPSLTELSDQARLEALRRFKIIEPYLNGQVSLNHIGQTQRVPYGTLRRWVYRYRQNGLVGLARVKRRDADQHRLPPKLLQLIEALALQKTKLSAAAIHRQVESLAQHNGWPSPSYSTVYEIIRDIHPALILLAHEGSKAYQQEYDLLYRREAQRPNQIWQADHSLLDIWLVLDDGTTKRPWLTAIEDDHSRCIAGYFLSFDHPATQQTSLALRQAIWRKPEAEWRICGIPDVFYTDNGSDFTSHHMEQVAADIKMQLIFSTPGMPRGRGRLERFFSTVNQLFLHELPGYAPKARPLSTPTLTLAQFDLRFRRFLLHIYHERVQKELKMSPQVRWEQDNFLPRMPVSLEQIDLLLMTVAKSRKVRRDGIHFQTMRYMDVALSAYVGETVIVRYDPRDMAEIRVYHDGRFLCRAVCQELADRIVSLQDIIRARNRRRRDLRANLKERSALIETYLAIHAETPESSHVIEEDQSEAASQKRLKLYHNE